MAYAFCTQAVTCPKCAAILGEDAEPVEPVRDAPDGDYPAFSGVVPTLDNVADEFAGLKLCHAVRGMVIGHEANDATFVVDKSGFRWTFRWDD